MPANRQSIAGRKQPIAAFQVRNRRAPRQIRQNLERLLVFPCRTGVGMRVANQLWNGFDEPAIDAFIDSRFERIRRSNEDQH